MANRRYYCKQTDRRPPAGKACTRRRWSGPVHRFTSPGLPLVNILVLALGLAGVAALTLAGWGCARWEGDSDQLPGSTFSERVMYLLGREVAASSPESTGHSRLEVLRSMEAQVTRSLDLAVGEGVSGELGVYFTSPGYLAARDGGGLRLFLDGMGGHLEWAGSSPDGDEEPGVSPQTYREALAALPQGKEGADYSAPWRFLRAGVEAHEPWLSNLADQAVNTGEREVWNRVARWAGQVVQVLAEEHHMEPGAGAGAYPEWEAGLEPAQGADQDGDREEVAGRLRYSLVHNLVRELCAGSLTSQERYHCLGAVGKVVSGEEGSEVWSVLLDPRGVPLPLYLPDGGLPAPLVDLDRDGVADTDDRGRFLGADGGPMELPPFANQSTAGEYRDRDGRALTNDKRRPIFQYLDVRKSLLGLAGGAIMEEVAPEGGDGIRALVRGLATGEHGEGGYTGEGRSDSLMPHILWVVHQVASYPRLGQLLLVTGGFLSSNKEVVERVLIEGARAGAIVAEEREQRGLTGPGDGLLARGNTLVDDLIGANPHRDQEVGKPCVPGEWPDSCNSSWLRCEPEGGGSPDRGRCVFAPGVTYLPGILEEMVREGLLVELIDSINGTDHWRWQALPRALELMIRFKGQDFPMERVDTGICPDYDQEFAFYPGELKSHDQFPFSVPVEWTPSRNPDQDQSFLQGYLHLFHQLNRHPWALSVGAQVHQGGGREEGADQGTGDGWNLDIPNLGEVAVDVCAGNLQLTVQADSVDQGDLLREACEFTLHDPPSPSGGGGEGSMGGVGGNPGAPLEPDPWQLILFALREHPSMGSSLELDGCPIRECHGEAMVAGATSGLVHALAPLARVFSTSGPQSSVPRIMGAPGGRSQLLLDLISTVHDHYQGDGAWKGTPGTFGTRAGLRDGERVMARVLGETELAGAILELIKALRQTSVCQVGSGVSMNTSSCHGQGRHLLNGAGELVAFLEWLTDRQVTVCAVDDRECLSRRARQMETGSSEVLPSSPLPRGGLRGGVVPGESDTGRWEHHPSRLHLLIHTWRLVEERLLTHPDSRVVRAAGDVQWWPRVRATDGDDHIDQNDHSEPRFELENPAILHIWERLAVVGGSRVVFMENELGIHTFARRLGRLFARLEPLLSSEHLLDLARVWETPAQSPSPAPGPVNPLKNSPPGGVPEDGVDPPPPSLSSLALQGVFHLVQQGRSHHTGFTRAGRVDSLLVLGGLLRSSPLWFWDLMEGVHLLSEADHDRVLVRLWANLFTGDRSGRETLIPMEVFLTLAHGLAVPDHYLDQDGEGHPPEPVDQAALRTSFQVQAPYLLDPGAGMERLLGKIIEQLD